MMGSKLVGSVSRARFRAATAAFDGDFDDCVVSFSLSAGGLSACSVQTRFGEPLLFRLDAGVLIVRSHTLSTLPSEARQSYLINNQHYSKIRAGRSTVIPITR